MKEHKRRSIVKGISYRFFGTMMTIIITFIVTGNVKSSFSIGALDVISKVFLYYFHERAWQRTTWGKHTN